jgi:hypothetical protein
MPEGAEMRSILLTILLILSAAPAQSAITLQPGEWQTTEAGTENGKAAKPEIEKSCMTAEEARDAVNIVNQMKQQMQGQAGQCEKYDVKQNGNAVTFVMKCGMGQQFLMDIAGTFTFVSATRYTGAIKSSIKLGANTTTSDKTIEAVRIGDCKAGGRKK